MTGSDLGSIGLRDGVALEIRDEVATVTFRRLRQLGTPALDRSRRLAAIGGGLPGAVRVVVLKADADAEGPVITDQAAFTWWQRPDLVSIAAVHGHVVGALFQLVLACDLRVITSDTRFAARDLADGRVPDLGGTGALVDAVGYQRAVELCVTGRWVDAEEARHLRLAEVITKVEEIDARVEGLVASVLAAPRDAVIETKALLAATAGRGTAERLTAERQAQARLLRSEPE
jgi:enoyl-CoA hydratase/carnithine racemase